MEDYPRTPMEFEQRFSSEQACRDYLYNLRWPDGFVCPRCGYQEAWKTDRGLYKCKSCGYQTSITAGTIFQDTKKPLQMWFRAMWYVTNQKHGVSALELQRALGFGSYRTAWTLLHKLRYAMVRPQGVIASLALLKLMKLISVGRNPFIVVEGLQGKHWYL